MAGDDRMTTLGLTLVDAGPQLELDHLYRARVFQSNDKFMEALCRPDLHLGSPPTSLASAGRMNARGSSVFYGTTKATAAIGEVRPLSPEREAFRILNRASRSVT